MEKLFFAGCAIFFATLLPGDAYKAAVLEHAPISDQAGPRENILKNIEFYRQLTETVELDIVVFPEYGLTTIDVTDLPNTAIVIDESQYPYKYEKILEDLSAMSQERRTYIVVNLLEKSNATGKWLYYNTNLVFDRNNGSIIAKYRKINLYKEDLLTPGNETVTFTTDFGVTFGLLTCFDILFHHPSITVLQNTRVTDIVYPTAWISEVPFFAALSVQSGYASANGVNLLAANYDKPSEGLGGSGLYDAQNYAETYIDQVLSSKLIVGELPVRSTREATGTCNTDRSNVNTFALPGQSSGPNTTLFRTDVFKFNSSYKFTDIDLKSTVNASFHSTVCHNELCCHFNLTTVNYNNNEVYKLLAFNGTREVDNRQAPIQICSLVACKTASVDSCGHRFDPVTTFSSITISAEYQNDDNSVFLPITLTNKLAPVTKYVYCKYHRTANDIIAEVNLKQEQSNILAFGIVGVGKLTSSAMLNTVSLTAVIVSIITMIINHQ